MRLFKIIAAVLLAAVFAVPVFGQDMTGDELYRADDFGAGSILDALPDELKNKLPGGDVFSADGFSGAFTADYFLGIISDAINQALSPAVKSLAVTLGLVLMSSGIGALKNILPDGSLISLFDFVSGLCIMLSMYSMVLGLAESVSIYLGRLSTLMYAMIPVMIAVGTAGGNVSSSSVASNAMMLGLAFVETLASKGLFPVIQLCMGLSIASGVGGGLKLGGISKLVRDALTWILALISASISAIMTFQTSIASRADSLSMRTMKFAASNAVPVVGGIAGDAIGAVAESLSLVRGTVGWVGVILIVLMTLPVTLKVILTRLGVLFSQTAADILGLDREKAILSEMCGLLGFLAAVCVICGIMFIYAAALFAGSSAALS